MDLNDLKNRLSVSLERQEALLTASDTEQREFTEAESAEFDNLTREVAQLSKQIQAEQKKEEARTQIAMHKINSGQARKSEEQKVAQSFSLLRTLNNLTKGIHPDNMEGAEGEMHQEATREAKESGRSLLGFGLPAMMVRAGQDATVAATAANLIATNLDGTVIPALRPKTVLSSLGAMSMTGLIGNLDLPAGDGIATATWEGELDTHANTDPSTALISLRPNRLAAYTDVSKQLLIQTSNSAEAWIRAELSDAVGRAVDTAGIKGNSAGIDGILGTSGVTDVTFGGAVTRAKLINLLTKIAMENADEADIAFLMHPIIRGELQSLKTDSGSGLFVMDQPNRLLGYNVGVSNLVPTNIDGSKTAVIVGNFRDVILANWGGVDLIVDPYTKAATGQVKIITNSYWDVALKHAKSFAFGNDITFTAIS